jgi:hypothetical protein
MTAMTGPRRRASSGIVLLALCGTASAGCGTGGSSSASGAAAVAPVERAQGAVAGGDQAKAPNVRTDQPLPVPGRQVVRSATIGIRVTALAAAEGDVRRIATAAGGYAGEEDDENGSASFTLQVPQAGLDGVLDQLSHLGTPTSRTEQAQDVTSQLVDVRSRLTSQQASVDRVRALMAKATSIGDVVSIEGELTKRESDLESLEQQQAELSGQVAMTTVTVRLTSAPAAPTKAPGQAGFLGGLDSGWHAFLGALRVLLVVLGAVLPFAIVLAALGIPTWWLLRRRRAATAGSSPSGE